LSLGLAAAALLATARPAAAQFRTSGLTGNNSLGGGLGGTSSFGAGGGLSSGLSSGGFGSGMSSGNLGSGGFGSGNLGSGGFGNTSFGFSNTGGTGNRSGASTGSFRPTGGQSYGSTSFTGQYFGNPLSLGLVTSNGQASQMTFGQALYNVNTTTGGSAYGNYGGVSPLGGRTGTTTNLGALGGNLGGVRAGALGGATNLGGTALVNSTGTTSQTFTPAGAGVVRRAPAFVATIGFTPTPLSPSRLTVDLQDTISRSSQLPSRGNIQVSLDGPAVILRGEVADESERSLAEGMLRLTPGVHEVRNELTVRGPAGP
jgi:hypothetical protein